MSADRTIDVSLTEGAGRGEWPVRVRTIRNWYWEDLVCVHGPGQTAAVDVARLDDAINLLQIVQDRPGVLSSLIGALELVRADRSEDSTGPTSAASETPEAVAP